MREQKRKQSNLVAVCAVLSALFAVSLVVLGILKKDPALSERITRGLSRKITTFFSRLTDTFSFSLFEWIYVLLLLGAVTFVIFGIVMLVKGKHKRVLRTAAVILAGALGVINAYQLACGFAYNRAPLYEALSLPSVTVDAELMDDAAVFYVESLNALADEVERDESGNIRLPWSFSELADVLKKEYARLADNAYFNPYTPTAKPILLSVPMTYTKITGIYQSLTGEANVNTNIPPYDLPVTMAHELAHAKGVMRENEANFLAYFLLITSKDPTLRYCGLMCAVNSSVVALYDADAPERFYEVRDSISPLVRQEFQNYSEHFDRYDGIIDEISSFFNDLYLKSSGVKEGEKSYSMTDRFLAGLYVMLTENV